MKIIKYIFFLLLLCVIAGSIFIGTQNGSYEITADKTFDAPHELIYKTISDYKNLSQWNPYERDEDTFTYISEQNEPGSGRWERNDKIYDLETMQQIPSKKIKQRLKAPDRDTLNFEQLIWTIEKIQDLETNVTLTVKGELTFKDKIVQFFEDKELDERKRSMIQNGFDKLDNHLDALMDVYSIDIKGVTEYGGGFYMYTATASSISAMPQKLSQMLPVVQAYVTSNNIPQTGKPFTIYNDFNTALGTTIFSAAIPVRDRVITPTTSNVLCDFMPRQTVVKAILTGDYKHLAEAWEKIRSYISKEGISMNSELPAFEIYRVDSSAKANPAEWITELYIPVQPDQPVDDDRNL